jgi:hypothetical protein
MGSARDTKPSCVLLLSNTEAARGRYNLSLKMERATVNQRAPDVRHDRILEEHFPDAPLSRHSVQTQEDTSALVNERREEGK